MKISESYIKTMIASLREHADKHGLKLVFRNHSTNAGDFCFFIYKKSGGRYLIGYDGDWTAEENEMWSFMNCYKAAHAYISNYDN